MELLNGRPYYPSSFNLDVAVELARTIRLQTPDLDALVLTGDLATTGHDSDLGVATRFMRGDLPEHWSPFAVPALVQPDSFPVVALPGNHDRYEGVALFPNSKAFERHVDEDWSFGSGATHSIAGTDPRVKLLRLEKSNVALVLSFADFTLASEHDGEGLTGYIGQGRVGRELLQDLVRSTRVALAEARRDGLHAAAAWVVHYPPEFDGISQSLQLLDDAVLVAAASDLGVPLVLAGHTHEARSYVCKSSVAGGSPVRVVCAGAATGVSANEVFEFAVLRIDVGLNRMVSITLEPYRWDGSDGTFVLQTPTQFPLP